MSVKNDRKKMIREAKNYQRERKIEERKKTVKIKNVNITEDIPVNEYNDGFYVDESRIRKEKAAKIKKQKNKKQKAPISPKRRRIKHIITYVVIFSVVVIIGIVLSLTVLFKTEKINVEGNTLYDDEQIIQLSSVQLEENIFLAKFGATPEKIEDVLPYIEEARVDFKIPDTITITVKNAEPAYVVVIDNKFYKISASGRILELSQQNIEDLPIILCSNIKNTEIGKYLEYSDESIVKFLKEINDCIEANEYKNINFIDIRDPAKISLIYDYRIKIVIGLPEDISYKLKTAMTIIAEKLDQNGTVRSEGTLDVSKCNSTKKSYFKDEKIQLDVALPTVATQPQTEQPTTQPETQPATEWIPDDSYTWTPSDDGGYSYDDYSDGGYSDDYTGDDYSDGGYSDDYSGDDYSDGGYSDDYSGDYSDGGYSDGYSGDGYNGDDYSDGGYSAE